MSSLKDEFNEKKEDLKDSISEKKEDLKESFNEKKEAFNDSILDTKDAIGESIGTGVKKTVSFLKKALLVGLVLSIIAGGFYLLWANWTFSEGTRTGYLQKLSNKGVVFKTWEGQLNTGGFQEDQSTLLGAIWEFSVTDDEIIEELQDLEGKRVKIYYKEIFKSMPWQGDTKYFVQAVEEN